YFYWQDFGVNALDYISFQDVVFAPLEFLIGYVALMVFVIFVNRAFTFFRNRRISQFDNLYCFILYFFGGVISFVLSRLDFLVPSYEVFNFIFVICMVFIPEFFPYTPWGEKYFKSPAEAHAYSATFFIGLALISFSPSWASGIKINELNRLDNQMPIVKLINCQTCSYSVLGKLGSFVIAYDRKAGSVVSISDRNVEYIQHHPFYTPDGS
ncbi:hypothetical protein, partial [Vreelandella lionensis]|uniref:hypothetical protein n=1 Tax=Vreelandella lionensis TaxID=1144478 RepID=UPI0013747612